MDVSLYLLWFLYDDRTWRIVSLLGLSVSEAVVLIGVVSYTFLEVITTWSVLLHHFQHCSSDWCTSIIFHIIISPWFYQLTQIESLDRYEYHTQCFMRNVGRHISLTSLGQVISLPIWTGNNKSDHSSGNIASLLVSSSIWYSQHLFANTVCKLISCQMLIDAVHSRRASLQIQ